MDKHTGNQKNAGQAYGGAESNLVWEGGTFSSTCFPASDSMHMVNAHTLHRRKSVFCTVNVQNGKMVDYVSFDDRISAFYRWVAKCTFTVQNDMSCSIAGLHLEEAGAGRGGGACV
jgi:hypothetical protein